jgi:cellulose synthase/poly-beta-1,6-N-acetylglucosamine synthase-like glycosyltransferase
MSTDALRGGTAAPTVLTEQVFKWWDYLLYAALSCLGFAAIAFFLFSWFQLREWRTVPAIMVVLTLMVLVILVNNQSRWFLLPWMRRPKPMTPKPHWKVAVVTTFVEGAEPIEMLAETVRALKALDYPHDTWVLDEADHEHVKALCQKFGAHHFSRKHLPQYQAGTGPFQARSKHGNYNAWLYEMGFDRYDILAAFDPDHVPAPAFLSQVLGYFNDPTIGYVQTPQTYYNQHASFIARGAAEETYAYYSSVQMASYGLGYPIVIGCHNTHRMAALKDVAGFASHDADDLLITLLYRSRGWQGVYVPTILARGLTPVDWRAYLGQQRRWARAVLDLKIRSYPKVSDELPWKSRLISLLHGLNYLHKSLLIPTGLIVLALLLATGIVSNVYTGGTLFRLVVLLAAFVLCELYRQRFYLDWKKEWGLHWRAGLLQFAKWPYVLLAFFDVLMDRRIPYVLTPKVSYHSKASILMWPQLVVVAVLSTAWIVSFLKGVVISPFLHLGAAGVMAISLILILTERFTFPAPYTGSSDLLKAHMPLPGSSLTDIP